MKFWFLFAALFFIAAVVFFSCMAFVGCGTSEKSAKKVDDNDPSFVNEIKPLTQKYCVSCHSSDNFVTKASYFVNNTVLGKLKSKEMPKAPSKEASSITEAERQKMIDYIVANQSNGNSNSGGY